MFTVLLLVLIYLAFISLGLPDSLLGVSWPQMRMEWGLPLDMAGYVSIFIVAFTVLSGVLSGKLIRLLGTGKVTGVSCFLTGISIIGIAHTPSFHWLVILSCSLGFGAGSVDTALNHYVALHFKAHHMNWLHSFWGVGASIGPLFISHAFAAGDSWRTGYLQVGSIQIALAVLFLLCLPLWRMHSSVAQEKNASDADSLDEKLTVNSKEKVHAIRKKGVIPMILAFAIYSGAEGGAGLWGSTYLVIARGISVESAALFISVYFIGITTGRILAGFISFKVKNMQMIRGGVVLAVLGAVCILLPLPGTFLAVAFYVFGLGLAPLFPSMIQEVPNRFEKQYSQDIIGYQIAGAYAGFCDFFRHC